jgi:hypothetical protein
MQQHVSSKAILGAVGELLAEERTHRLALADRIDEYGNLVRVPGPQGERGLQGDAGRDGAPGDAGPAGLPGPPGLPGEPGRDGRDGLHGLPGPIGERGMTGERGLDGPAGPAGAIGERGATGEPAYPGRACGLYSPSETYRAMDVVAHNGSEWRAVYDSPGPLPGDGWMLGAKGSRGKPGDRGEKGERGDPGQKGDRGLPGPSITKLVVSDYEVVLMLSDGKQLSASLLPLLERYHQEAMA